MSEDVTEISEKATWTRAGGMFQAKARPNAKAETWRGAW